MALNKLITDFPVTAVVTSAVYTVPSGVSTFSYDLTIAAPLTALASIEYVLEKSTDGGATFVPFDDNQFVGGPIAKGDNAGQQAVQEDTGEIDNLVQGNQIRARVVSIQPAVASVATRQNNSSTTLALDSAPALANGDMIKLGSEIQQIVSGGGTNTLTVTRAQLGTSAAAHAVGVDVLLPWVLNASITAN